MRSTCLLSTLLLSTLLACGAPGSPGPGTDPRPDVPAPVPVTRVLARSVSATFDAGSNYGFGFALPSSASVSFSASQTTTDTWNVALFSAKQWADYQAGTSNLAYGGIHNNVMQAADRVQLPAGDWYLGFHCNNAFQRCMLVFSLDATY